MGMESRLQLLISQLGENRVKTDVDLSEHLYTKLGGIAKAFYIATTSRELIKVIELCQELKLNFLIIGMGSKMAISENGFDGLAIKNRSDSLKIFGIKGKVSKDGLGIEEALIEADSGTSLNKLSEFASIQKLGGFEVLKSTLGTVGGSFLTNAVLLDKAQQVKIITEDGDLVEKLPKAVNKEDIIISVIFKLKAQKTQ